MIHQSFPARVDAAVDHFGSQQTGDGVAFPQWSLRVGFAQQHPVDVHLESRPIVAADHQMPGLGADLVQRGQHLRHPRRILGAQLKADRGVEREQVVDQAVVATVLAEQGLAPDARGTAQTDADGEGGSGRIEQASRALSGVEIAAIELGDDTITAAGQRFMAFLPLQPFSDRDSAHGGEAVLARGVLEVPQVPHGAGGLEDHVG